MHGVVRIDSALALARRRLNALTDTAAIEAELLLAHVLKCPRSHLHAWPERLLGASQQTMFTCLLDRRTDGEPLAYLLGHREFWSLNLEVTPRVLIPRADTETLVERALELLPPASTARVADLGTGSGAIALAVAHERPRVTVVATDRSSHALAVAQCNADHLRLCNVELRRGNWCAALGNERFDLILSNPPYIAADDPHLLRGDLQHEPREALVSGTDGLDDLRHIIACAPSHLNRGGHLLLEHGYAQGKAVRNLLCNTGFVQVRTHRDLEHRERISEGLHSGTAHMKHLQDSGIHHE